MTSNSPAAPIASSFNEHLDWAALVDKARIDENSFLQLVQFSKGETLLARAFGCSAQNGSWEEVQPLANALLDQGASLYAAAPGQGLLGVIVDPAKLQGWLSLGGDPCALGADGPQWWSLMERQDSTLLDVLREDPRWPRWGRAKNMVGRSVLHHWVDACALRPNVSFKTSMVMFDWLIEHTDVQVGYSLTDTTAPLLGFDHWTELLLTKALKSAENGFVPTAALNVWHTLLTERFTATDLSWVEHAFKDWCNTNRRVKKYPDFLTRLRQPLEHLVLRSMGLPKPLQTGTNPRRRL